MNRTVKTIQSLVLFTLIVCNLTGCVTTKKNIVVNEKNTTPTISVADKFYKRNTEIIRVIEDHHYAAELKAVKEKLEEGYDFNLLWFIPINMSTDGLTYSEKFLEKENGSVEIVIDEKGKGNFTLSVLF